MCECVLFSVQRSRRGPSEPHTYSPRVVCENFVFFLHDAGVCALVDGVGHYGYVVVLQGDVVGVRVLQQLPVLVPAEKQRSDVETVQSHCGFTAVRRVDTHYTLPFFDAIFFPQRKVSFLPSTTSLCLVLRGVGVGATVGNGNSGGERVETLQI